MGPVTRQFTAGAVMAIALLLILPAVPAQAFTCADNIIVHVAVSPHSNGRGARSTAMQAFNGSVVCAHVSSIGDVSTTTQAFVESGWLENPVDKISDCATTNGTPKWFTFYTRINGTFNCNQGGAVTVGNSISYGVHDDNLDGIWVLAVNGITRDTIDMGVFTTGQPQGNAERRADGDSNRADIAGLERMNSSAVFVPFDTPLIKDDLDPDWNACAGALANLELNVTMTC